MNINYVAVLVAAVAQFIFGAIWYTPIFGKLWGKIHGFDTKSKEEQKEMMKQMMPLLVLQLFFTIIATVVFATLIGGAFAGYGLYHLALLLWLGFIVPTQVSAVLFGGTEPKWVVTKSLIMIFGALGCVLILAFVMNMFK